jgi:hypothetical protein
VGLFKLKGWKTTALLLAWVRPSLSPTLVKLDDRDAAIITSCLRGNPVELAAAVLAAAELRGGDSVATPWLAVLPRTLVAPGDDRAAGRGNRRGRDRRFRRPGTATVRAAVSKFPETPFSWGYRKEERLVTAHNPDRWRCFRGGALFRGAATSVRRRRHAHVISEAA